MKKGFTMIELIFVIVILGILAAVAIPRLAGTRDDAAVSATAQNIATLMQDLAVYYTARGELSTTLTDMTGVPGTISVQTGQNCLTVGTIRPIGEVDVTINDSNKCAQVWALPAMAPIKTKLEADKVGGATATIKVAGTELLR